MSKNIASHYLYTDGVDMDTFVSNSRSLSSADLGHTIAAMGALETLEASKRVVSTLLTDGEDIAVLYDALSNPFAHSSLWLLAFASRGDLYNSMGYRISSMGWDFEYNEASGGFTTADSLHASYGDL